MNKITIYTSEKKENRVGALTKEMWEEIYASRHVIIQVFIRDLKAAYKSYLGYLWAVIPGLTTTAIWMFLNSQKTSSSCRDAYPYPLYVLVGSTLWMFLRVQFRHPWLLSSRKRCFYEVKSFSLPSSWPA